MDSSESASQLLHFLDSSASERQQELGQDDPVDSAVWSMVQEAVTRAGGSGEVPITLHVDVNAAFTFDHDLGRSLLLDSGGSNMRAACLPRRPFAYAITSIKTHLLRSFLPPCSSADEKHRCCCN